jgi:PAS domain S-box-containing protein
VLGEHSEAAPLSIAQLQRAIAAIGAEATTATIARMAVREATLLCGASHAILAFFDLAGDLESVTRHTVGAEHDDTPVLHPHEGFVQRAFTEDQAIAEPLEPGGQQLAVAVPCRLGSRVVGALGVILSSAGRALGDEELAALLLLASTSAAFIENARLNDFAQQEILRSQDLDEPWLSRVEANPSDMVFVVDRHGRILDVNRTTCRLLGYTKYELVQRSIADVVPSPSRREDQPVLKALLEDIVAGRVTEFESAYVTKSGRVFPVDVRVQLLEADGETVIVGVCRDISERRRAEAQLVQSARLRALGEMAAGVVHDINNMLTAVLGPIEVLMASSTDPHTQRILPAVQRALLDGARTVQRIHAFARQSGSTALSEVDVAALAEEVVELTRPRWQTQARQHGVEIAVEVQSAGAPTVLGNVAELREVLLNLVGNAIDAMPKGGRIVIRVAGGDERLTLRVSDTGVGMPPEVAQRVFDPFFTTKGEKGSGLGLSVVYGIVSRHGGQIAVDSTPGQGTTFTITLPRRREASTAPAAPAEPAATDKVQVLATQPLNIMVIDDQPDVATVLRLILELDGHAVATFTRGPEALAQLGRQRFHLVCTDLNMTEMDGWEIARLVKERCPDTLVALVTGWSEHYSPQEIQERSVDFILRKPYQVNDVRQLIAAVYQRAGLAAARG